MTGASERPSRSSPETRKAATGSSASTSRALKAVHAAERDLLRVAQRDELTHAIATLTHQMALATAAKAQAISAHTAGKIATLDPLLPASSRAAAVARFKDEEAAELAAMLLDEAGRGRQMRRASIGVLKAAQRQRVSDLRRRQRAERMVMAVAGHGRDRRGIADGGRRASAYSFAVRFRSTH